ncbi:MAG: hypothetical protein HY689_09425 [Chloroflexi bacterium]|nr:hypothetical protein [Chloroflexota bacterium]
MSAWARLPGRYWAALGHGWRVLDRDLRLPPPAAATSRRVVVAALLLGLLAAVFNQLAVPLRASHSARVTADEPFYLLTTVSLLADGDLDLTNDYALQRYRAYFDHPQDLWHQSVPTTDGRLLSPHNLGTSLLVLPAYALGGLDGAKRFLAVLGGATVAFMVLLAYRAIGHLPAALAAATLVGGSAPLFIYSAQIYPEGASALLVTACAWLLLGRQPGPRSAVLLALGLSGLAWLGAKYALVGSAIALPGLVRLRPGARLLLVALLVPSAAAYAWFHLATYGGLTPYIVNRLYAGSTTVELIGAHLELWNRLSRLAGLWIDGEFGLVRWAPILLLALPGVPLLARRPGPVRWVLPLVIGAQVLVAVFFSITMRGWWFPGRMLIAVLPLLAVPLAVTLVQVRGRPLLAGLAAFLGIATLGISLALREAVAAERVVLAVDPFALPWPPFQAVAALVPVYTTYQTSTWLLTAGWVLVMGALVAVGRRLQASPPPAAAPEDVALEPSSRQLREAP